MEDSKEKLEITAANSDEVKNLDEKVEDSVKLASSLTAQNDNRNVDSVKSEMAAKEIDVNTDLSISNKDLAPESSSKPELFASPSVNKVEVSATNIAPKVEDSQVLTASATSNLEKTDVQSDVKMVSSKLPFTTVDSNEADNIENDTENTRKIIAEDQDWSLSTVPLLKDLILNHIIKNFANNPILNQLNPKDKEKVLEKLDINIPLEITANLIEDEEYWKRCSINKWESCDVSVHGDSWKRLYFEKYLGRLIELFVPLKTDLSAIHNAMHFYSKHIKRLNVRQLLPPVLDDNQFVQEESGSDYGSDSQLTRSRMDHFEFSCLSQHLQHLEELRVVYGVRDCGMNFEWNQFKFTNYDCLHLALFIKTSSKLKVLIIQESRLDDDKVRILVKQLLDHPSLEEINFSHNCISNRGARAVAKLMNKRCPNLLKVNLYDNAIEGPGAKAIAYALRNSNKLEELNLRFNRLGDQGGKAICHALLVNTGLQVLNLSSNNLSELTVSIISHVLKCNGVLRFIDISGNNIGREGGKQLHAGMIDNSTLVGLDLHLCDAGPDNQYYIAQKLYLNKNQESVLQFFC